MALAGAGGTALGAPLPGGQRESHFSKLVASPELALGLPGSRPAGLGTGRGRAGRTSGKKPEEGQGQARR